MSSQASPSSGPPLAGRRAIVTGASHGIGAATVQRLAADGAAVAVNYIGSEDEARALSAGIRAAGGTAVDVEGDVSSEEDVERMFGEASSALGGTIDILVNNAGVEAPYALVDMPLEEWRRVLSIDLTGVFLCARQAARGMIAAGSGGVIVNMSSVHEVIPWARFSHYCASKGAMRLFAQTIAKELAPHGIRVVNIGPGAIMTPINKNLEENAAARHAVEAEIPLGRIGQAQEIAAAVAWLAGPEAGYVTGTTLFVDGGMTTYPNFV